MKASQIFYSHDMNCERGYRWHFLSFSVGDVVDLSSEQELSRGGVERLTKWFDKHGTTKQVWFDGVGGREALKIRFQQSIDNGVWSDCYAARIEEAEVSDLHCKLLAKLIKIFDTPCGAFELNLKKAIANLQAAGARQVVRDRNNGVIVCPSSEGFVSSEFDGLTPEQIPEQFRVVEAVA